jgi:hypothetical protein
VEDHARLDKPAKLGADMLSAKRVPANLGGSMIVSAM